VDGLSTSWLEAGSGSPVVLLHSGEYGASATLSWERTIGALATRYRVLAPDWLGYGNSAKVHDFTRGTGYLVSHMSRLCSALGIDGAPFVANSLGASLLLADACSSEPQLPATSIVAICGGGAVLDNEHYSALVDYDLSLEGMKRILYALFSDPALYDDKDYLARRHELSKVPGAWACTSAARLRPPDDDEAARPKRPAPEYERIAVNTLLIAGTSDKLKPLGWAEDVAARIPNSDVTSVDAGHCPQIERPGDVNELLLEFLEAQPAFATSSSSHQTN
jgi:2-hydroxymuconate-semialdehyde hydrolase